MCRRKHATFAENADDGQTAEATEPSDAPTARDKNEVTGDINNEATDDKNNEAMGDKKNETVAAAVTETVAPTATGGRGADDDDDGAETGREDTGLLRPTGPAADRADAAVRRSVSHDGGSGVNGAATPATDRFETCDPNRAIVQVLDRVDTPLSRSAAVGGGRKVGGGGGQPTGDAAFSVLPADASADRVAEYNDTCDCTDCRKKSLRSSE